MCKTVRFLSVCVTLLASSVSLAGGDDLFSDVRTNTVYQDNLPADSRAAPVSTRITGVDSLRDLLNSAGFDAAVTGRRTVTLKKQLDVWTFPVMTVLSEDEQSIAIVLGLRSIKDSSTLSSETLLKLMSASQKNAPCLFAYNGERERTELHLVLKNQRLTGQHLRDEINRMAIIARDNSELWAAPENQQQSNNEKPADDKQAGEKPADNASPTPVTPATPSTADLTGTWSAAKSATEAFAVQFSTDGSFSLVYVNNGTQVRSSGRFTTANGQLTLEGSDGLKLTGRLTMTSEKEFTFTPATSGELKFIKAG
ncbi:MAG: hypothetical protein RIK87_00850 [Fuerstiella sp.]